jgi:dTDP-4-amino-4,6-dideoxygalactose transaminase
MIPFVDLRAQYLAIRDELTAAVTGVLESGQYVLGPEVEAFEQEFASYCGARHAVAVNSGTSALHLAFLAAGIGPRAEVVTTPLTFVATAAAIGYAGAQPVFVDIDPETLNLDPARIEAALTPRTRAIVPVHLHGRPADMDPILELARRHRLKVIEDAAQVHGAKYKGRRVGALGDLGCFSFYPGKNLGACGEGGAVVTDDPEFDRTLRLLRDWGAGRKYHHDLKGFNYRMEAIQGAILRVKLRHLEAWTEARRSRAAIYDRLLAGSKVRTPRPGPDERHVYHVYAVRVRGRDVVQQALAGRGVQTGIHYPIPVHLQKAYADLGYRPRDFPHAERAAAELLSLPMFAELGDAQVAEAAEALLTAVARAVAPDDGPGGLP